MPDAVCVVVCGSKDVHLLYNSDDEPLARKDEGIKLTVPGGESKPAYGIKYVDKKWGPYKPVVILGYNCIGRAVSIRSNTRVINYHIAGYQRGKNAADTRQMLMRSAGYTREVQAHVCIPGLTGSC